MSIIPKGKEPANVKKRIDTLFPKLDSAYPDKVIISLQKDHHKWDETAREISKQLGYESKNDFLEAYGYKIQQAKNGRTANDHMAIIEELKKRYPNGSPFQKLPDLAAANSDLAPKFKAMQNKANELFGMSFVKYLVNEGILIKDKKSNNEKKSRTSSTSTADKAKNAQSESSKSQAKILTLNEFFAELKKRYPLGIAYPWSITDFKNQNPDINFAKSTHDISTDDLHITINGRETTLTKWQYCIHILRGDYAFFDKAQLDYYLETFKEKYPDIPETFYKIERTEALPHYKAENFCQKEYGHSVADLLYEKGCLLSNYNMKNEIVKSIPADLKKPEFIVQSVEAELPILEKCDDYETQEIKDSVPSIIRFYERFANCCIRGFEEDISKIENILSANCNSNLQ